MWRTMQWQRVQRRRMKPVGTWSVWKRVRWPGRWGMWAPGSCWSLWWFLAIEFRGSPNVRGRVSRIVGGLERCRAKFLIKENYLKTNFSLLTFEKPAAKQMNQPKPPSGATKSGPNCEWFFRGFLTFFTPAPCLPITTSFNSFMSTLGRP